MSIDALLAAALAERDDEDACRAFIEQLLDHPDVAGVRAAVEPLIADADADVHTREVAIDVYGSLGLRDASKEDKQARVARLLTLLDAGESEWRVLESIAYAFAHLWQQQGAERIAALAGHPHPRVREAVTHAIGHTDHPAVIAALIALSTDPEDDVRDWATFGLGSMHSASRETPEVAAALVARLDDPHSATRDEAIVGLAVRRDARAIDPLVALVEDWEGPLLAASLVMLATAFPDDARLTAAIGTYFPEGIPDEVRTEALNDLEWHDECVAESAA